MSDEQTENIFPPHIELGATGIRRQGGQIWEERLRELRGYEGRILYREMRLNDPVITAVFAAIENSLLQANWRVYPASENEADLKAADFLRNCMEDMSFTWNNTLQFALGMLEQGFSLLEVVYKRRPDGRIGWRKMAPRPAETIIEWEFDEHGGIQAAIQNTPEQKRIVLPIERCLLFRTTVAPANSPEGLPIHRGMYLPWWYSQNIAEIEGIGVERDLAGIPVVYLGYDCTLSGTDSDYERAKDLVVNLRMDEQTGVVIPKPKMGSAGEGRGMLLELLSTGGRRQHDTSAIIERYDKRKALAVLAQFIMLGMERVGSYALSRTQGDLFTLSVSAWLHGLAEVFNKYAVKRLFEYNHFPGQTKLPRIVPSEVGIPDLASIADYINKLRMAQVLTPDTELERHLRQVARLPEKTKTSDIAGEDILSTTEQAERIGTYATTLRRITLATQNLVDSGYLTLAEAKEFLDKPVDQLREAMGLPVVGGAIDTPSSSSSFSSLADEMEILESFLNE